MKWKDYVAEVAYADRQHSQQPKPFIVRAVSVKHALYKATAKHPDAQRHEVEMCRCESNHVCDAHFRLETYATGNPLR